MNSTERLLACLRGEIPDRVPVNTYELVGWDRAQWQNNESSYAQLTEFVRQNTDCTYRTSVPVTNALEDQIDVKTETWEEGEERFTRTTYQADGRKLTALKSRMEKVKTTWHRERPCKSLQDLQAYLDMPWEAGQANFSGLEKAWEDLAGTRGLPMIDMRDALCEVAALFHTEDFVIHAMVETEVIVRAMDEFHERTVERLKRVLRGPVKNALFRICGPELATPPFLPPELFARFVTPYVSRYVQMIREAGAWPRIHIHGKIGRVLEEIKKIAPAAIDPIEPPPDGDIELISLKREIGGQICLMGGIEPRHLEAGDGNFVEKLVRELMAAGKPGGRFVIMPTAAPIDIPLPPRTEANYFRWIETALEVGKY